MATTNYNFTTISGTDTIDIVSAINTPLTEIDAKLKEVAESSGGNVSGLESRIAALESQMKKMKKGATYNDIRTNGFVYQSEA